ncbi:hypothetical protein LOD99_13942 [Oopsacas minuta]|uniref:CHHC U11-48K-type domain-containing protein n=1 Tax=Oopsacas minuta TaxID=111878 RepID=A0AAV7KK56_9METZ|nr:hypothetical protein LOD99_13942 [Oopsacas minuta]
MSLSEAEIEVRSVQLEIMRQRLEDCEYKTKLIELDISTDDSMQCPVNPQHYIKDTNKQHIRVCKYKQEGVSREEIRDFGIRGRERGLVIIPNKLEDDILRKMRGITEYKHVIKDIAGDESIDKQVNDSLHYSYDVLQSFRTPQERAFLYDYAVAKSKEIAPEITDTLPDPFHKIHKKVKKDTIESKITNSRDSKRRRKSYRGGKGVKILSLREETKNLIELYMNNFCE